MRARMIGCCAALSVAVVVALAGCALGPDPEVLRERSSAVFEELAAELSAVDTAVLRSVEVLPEERRPCGEADGEQASFVARGAVAVAAEDGAGAGALDDVAETLDPETWTPVPAEELPEPAEPWAMTERAWFSEDGIVVTLVDASPIVLVGVFPPCSG